MIQRSLSLQIIKWYMLVPSSYLTWVDHSNVQHCSPMIPRVVCTRRYPDRNWLRGLCYPLHLAHKSDAMEQAAVETNFGARPGIEPGTLRTRVKDLNHCATLLLIAAVVVVGSVVVVVLLLLLLQLLLHRMLLSLLLGKSFSVQHCSPMMPRVRCTNSLALPWSELTGRSLSSIAPAPKVRCFNGASSDGNNVLGSTGDPSHQSQRP